MLKALYPHDRVRCAISISPDFLIHKGHLFILACSKALSEKHNLELHLRFDDTYASCCKSHENYPAKKDAWSSGNPHKQVPGRAIYEWYRPPAMTEQYINTVMPIIDNLKMDIDRVYKATDNKQEIRSHFESNNFEWLADMPIYFTEDLVWNMSYVCRGEEWRWSGEYGYWSKMQEFLLKSIRPEGYELYYMPHIKTDKGEKISKSNPDHDKYMLNNMKSSEVKLVWDELYQQAKNAVDAI